MTTTTNRRDTQDFTAERNATNDARQAGAVERGELANYEAAVLERAGELAQAGYLAESRALVERELRSK